MGINSAVSSVYLRAIRFETQQFRERLEYPFNLPIFQKLSEINFLSPITCFVGENGVGKSTLIEAIAGLLGINAEGGNRNTLFSGTKSAFEGYARLVRATSHPREMFFLRAESFYGYAGYVEREGLKDAFDGKSLSAQSHGEAFLSVLRAKFKGKGLYLLDEPEAALSVQSQLAVLAIFERLVRDGSQIVLSSNSPIIIAHPRAEIFSVSAGGLAKQAYEETDSVKLTRSFVNNHRKIITDLLK